MAVKALLMAVKTLLTGTKALLTAVNAPLVPGNAPFVPAGAPSVPTGAPFVPTGAPSVPAGAPFVPVGAPSVPAGAPSMPVGAPSVGAGAPPVRYHAAMLHPNHPHRRIAALLLAVGAACAWTGTQTFAQASDPATAQAVPAGTSPTSVRGPLSFSAARAAVWSESPTAAGAQTQRMVLSGDVLIKLGSYEFHAARAVVWLERIDDSPLPIAPSASPRAGVYQVYIYFDRVGNPRGPASTSLAADRLPVRAVIDVDGAVGLRFDTLARARPADPFVDEAEAVRDESNRRAASPTAPTDDEGPLDGVPIPFQAERPFRQPIAVDPSTAKPYRNVREFRLGDDAAAINEGVARLPFGGENAPIFAKQGVITVSAGNLVYQGAKGASPIAEAAPTDAITPTTPTTIDTPDALASVIASDGVMIQYVDPRTNRGLQLQAQRAVVFLSAGKDAASGVTSFSVGEVAGVYLEGDVLATDGNYTVRGPKVYYDIQRNKAILLDAVFWTYDEDRGLPFYVRADVIRQESLREFSATKARFSTSAFFEPEFSLGAQTITIKRKEVTRTSAGSDPLAAPTRSGLVIEGARTDGFGQSTTTTITMVQASDITLNAEGLPIFYVPEFTGDPTTMLLKDVRFENSGANGPAVKTRWNMSPVLGFEEAEIDLLAQYYFDRGAGLGVDAAYEDDDSRGKLFALSIINDGGQDLLKPGTRREWDESTRGILLGEERITFGEHWTMFAEGSYISDEAFVDAFLEPFGETRREFTSQINLARKQDNSMFSAGAKSSLNDFVANEYLLQSKGYSVQKAPELTYLRQSDRVFEDLFDMGEVFWTQEYRYSHMAMQFDEVYARERGFDTDPLAQLAFGIDEDQRLSEALRGAGYREDSVNRLDTRQELSAPQKLGPVDVTPYIVGRATAYDNDFTTYSPQETDNTRLWASAGARASTQFQRIDDSVKSDFFDLNRIRHIVEPNITVWHAGTNVDRQDLPVYDDDVENLAEGSMARIGVDQVWQTKRGDPLAAAMGKAHSVDVFKFNAALVFSSGDVDPKNPFGRWVEFRPELSNPGNYATVDGAWQVSSAFALTSSTVYDLDTRQQDRTSGGFVITHSPRYSSFAELRYLNPLDSTFLDLGTSYQLTQRYRLAALGSYDISNGGFQGAGGELTRASDAYTLGLRLSYNNTTDSTSFGFVVKPALSTRKKRVKILDDEVDSATEVTTESIQ
jgi:hypothetical protein